MILGFMTGETAAHDLYLQCGGHVLTRMSPFIDILGEEVYSFAILNTTFSLSLHGKSL